jgi:hypothetical protein
MAGPRRTSVVNRLGFGGTTLLSRRRLPLSLTIGNHLDNLLAEDGNIVRLATGNQILADNGLIVRPVLNFASLDGFGFSVFESLIDHRPDLAGGFAGEPALLTSELTLLATKFALFTSEFALLASKFALL